MDDQAPAASGIDALQDLERSLSGQAALSAGLSEIERESERRGREILRLALQPQIDARGEGDVGEAIVVAGENGPVRLAHKRVHCRPLVTLFGEVRVMRMGYGAPGHDAIHPLDSELMLPARIWSYECQRRLVKAVVCGPFDEAIALIAEITGTTVPKRSAEQIVRDAAVDFESFYVARAANTIQPAAGEILIAAIDGKGIPMVKPGGAQHVVRRGKGEKANKKKMATGERHKVCVRHERMENPCLQSKPKRSCSSEIALICMAPAASRQASRRRPRRARETAGWVRASGWSRRCSARAVRGSARS